MVRSIGLVLAKGGAWSQFLTVAFPIWILSVIALLAWQRRSQRLGLARVVQEFAFDENQGPPADAIEAAVNRFTARLGRFAGGGAVATLVAGWWLVSLVALIWSLTTDVTLTRLHDPGYRAALGCESSLRGIAAHQTATMITRNIVAMLGCAAAVVSLLALDQALLRPRTRLLDELRLGLLPGVSSTGDSQRIAAEIRARSHATWSWQAAFFSWIWLFAKGISRAGAVMLVISLVISIATGIITNDMKTAMPNPLDFDLKPAEYRWARIQGPLLVILLQNLPMLVLALVAGVKCHGWLVDKRLRDRHLL